MKTKTPMQVLELQSAQQLLESVSARLLMAGEPSLSMAVSALTEKVERARDSVKIVRAEYAFEVA